MNAYPQLIKQNKFTKQIAGSVTATLGMILLTAAFLIAVPRANAVSAVATMDKNFMISAAQTNMTEVKLGQYADHNGKREGVKKFGLRMVKDHTALNNDLKMLAAQKDVTLPDSLDAKHKMMVEKLMAKKGSAFDNAYIAAMTEGHKNAIKTFKTESAKTKDTDVKNFAIKTIPVLKEHLKLIKALQ